MLKKFLFFNDVGYDVYFTRVFGKDAIRMTKRYDHRREGEVHCTQIINVKNLGEERLNAALDWMYDNIKEQSETGQFQEL